MSGTKEDIIKYRIEKSLKTFNDAKSLAGLGSWNSCVKLLYYSSFYLLTALLLKNGIKAETHKGVKTQFFNHFIKTGILEYDFSSFYSNLFSWRQEEDYEDFIDFKEKTVLRLITDVEEFNKKILELLIEPNT
jgi:uncharacterized protein (UPF0332 family)